MRVLHVTNIVSHHQLPLARSFVRRLGQNNFRFVATTAPMAERVKMGWNAQDNAPWILRAGENEADCREFNQWWNEADVVLCGERLIGKIAERLKTNKLTFYMSERWWKPPIRMARMLHPRFALMAYKFRQCARSNDFHYLPIGLYAANDMRKLASFHGRMWTWAYFTELPDPLPLCRERNEPLRILWAGRMLALKRVDILVRAFALLLKQNSKARLILIGDGPCRDKLQRLTQVLAISNNVDFRSSIPAIQVRNEMRKAHVYVFPSNAYEGWGAVLNEAMSEGCAVLASEATGSAKTMIRHGENGLLFQTGDHQRLAELLVQLNADEPLRRRLAIAGQKTISECWSPELAAEHFVAVSTALLAKSPVPKYSDGPMMQLGP